ncbi:proline and serine-rich protein 3 isoform X1 [Anguilla anguilla]|uniref:proline and serine-rich protein 3 isoform X1 n=1 Tax=Anguilla anguilla TaxID=7936 RepID=UPI0015A7AA5E|nr:proline and serine-rich protein 3 isoform X1 [Anguilla anguilla]
MKSSSRAIFTRQNIFPPDPRKPKTHYNPSPTKKIPKKQRKTNLSPVRLAKPTSLSVPQVEPLTLEGQSFTGPPSDPLPCMPPSTEPQPSFSESWPSTDQESSSANTTAFPQSEVLAHSASSGKYQASFTPATTQEDSVLAKYVERFRHGQPQSREERQRSAATVEEWQPFWWLSSSSPPSSSHDTKKPMQQGRASAHERNQLSTSPIEHIRPSPPLSPHGTPLDFSVMGLSDSSHCDPPDPGILQLQERASRLLQRSEHSLSSSSLPISSEGVGCSDLSSPFSVDEPAQRPVAPSLINHTTALNTGPTAMPSVGAFLASRTRPEDDILFQWRLRRKMEQARQWPLPHAQGPARHQPPVSSLAPQAQRGLYPSGVPTQRAAQLLPAAPQEAGVPGAPPVSAAPRSVPVASPAASSLPPDVPVAAHMHLLCDVLPCPLRHRPPERRRSPRKWEVPTRDPAHGPPIGRSSSTETESPSPPPPSSGTAEERRGAGERRAGRRSALQREEPVRGETRAVPSCSRKKSTSHSRVGEGSRVDSQKRPTQTERGVSRDRVGEERVTPWPDEPRRPQRERGQRSRKEGRPGDRAPPPSPIHNALGQVVSEVLFPTSESPLPPTTPGSLDSPRYTPPVPPQSPAPALPQCPAAAPSMPQAPEVVAQLLEEAEESDGLEFEDDPLLQVLRQQREWAKEQISEVDTILNEIQDDT